MGEVELTRRFVASCLRGVKPLVQSPVVQVLGLKKLACNTGESSYRYRVHISDGEFSISNFMLHSPLNNLVETDILKLHSVMKMTFFLTNFRDTHHVVGVITSVEIMSTSPAPDQEGEGRGVIGNPIFLNFPKIPVLASAASSGTQADQISAGFEDNNKVIPDPKDHATINNTIPGITLSGGFLAQAAKLKNGQSMMQESLYLQVLGSKRISSESPSIGISYRLLVSDGELKLSFAMIDRKLNYLMEATIIRPFTVIKVGRVFAAGKNDSRIIILILLGVTLEAQLNEQIGNPIEYNNNENSGDPSGGGDAIEGLSNDDANFAMPMEADADHLSKSESSSESNSHLNSNGGSNSSRNSGSNFHQTNTEPNSTSSLNPGSNSKTSAISVPPCKKCAVCNSPAGMKCSACKVVHYCSLEHQRGDWERHQKCCGPFRIEKHSTNALLGKQWVANRDFKAGEFLLEESPAFYGPWCGADGETMVPLLCIVCGVNSENRRKRFCNMCGWPVCSMQCQKNPIHSEMECGILKAAAEKDRHSSYSVLQNGGFQAQAFSTAIAILRGALLQKTPGKERLFPELFKLQHTTKSRREYIRLILHGPKTSGYMEILQRIFSDIINASDLTRLFRVLHLNSFCVSSYSIPDVTLKQRAIDGKTIDEEEDDLYSKQLVYLKASRLNHSCVPNCSWSIGPAPDFKIRIRTAVPIQKNEPLTIFYSVPPFHTETEFPTALRKCFLAEFNGIECKCARCSDPTEMGTFCAAITCTEAVCLRRGEKMGCDFGYMLPLDPLNTEPTSYWKCNKCGKLQTFAHMEKYQQEVTVGEQLEQENRATTNAIASVSLLESEQDRRRTHLLDVIQTMCSTREKYGGKVLHENHVFFLNATMRWLRMFETSGMNSTNFKILDLTQTWLMECVSFYNKVLPGINPKRAKLLMLLGSVLRSKLLHHPYSMTVEEKREAFKLFLRVNYESLQFYKGDFITEGEVKNAFADIIEARMIDMRDRLDSKVVEGVSAPLFS